MLSPLGSLGSSMTAPLFRNSVFSCLGDPGALAWDHCPSWRAGLGPAPLDAGRLCVRMPSGRATRRARSGVLTAWQRMMQSQACRS